MIESGVKMVKSPLNYTGGKYKLLPQILPLFPKEIDTFVDLFCGGCNVGINVEANKIVCNDIINYIIDLYKYFQETELDTLLEQIHNIVDSCDLTINENFLDLRKRYNERRNLVDFFVLVCYSFNYQIRFNNSQQYNSSSGKLRNKYNDSIEKNLKLFNTVLKEKNIVFSNKDFMDVDLSKLGKSDLVYADPPYLISTGCYNDGNRGFKNWTSKEETQLLDLLDSLDSNGVRFALSNVLYHKGLSNDLLIEWSKKYTVHYLEKHYKNCNYQVKDKESRTVEVLITNY